MRAKQMNKTINLWIKEYGEATPDRCNESRSDCFSELRINKLKYF